MVCYSQTFFLGILHILLEAEITKRGDGALFGRISLSYSSLFYLKGTSKEMGGLFGLMEDKSLNIIHPRAFLSNICWGRIYVKCQIAKASSLQRGVWSKVLLRNRMKCRIGGNSYRSWALNHKRSSAARWVKSLDTFIISRVTFFFCCLFLAFQQWMYWAKSHVTNVFKYWEN